MVNNLQMMYGFIGIVLFFLIICFSIYLYWFHTKKHQVNIIEELKKKQYPFDVI